VAVLKLNLPRFTDTDNVRPTSAGNVRVFDLSTAHGRTYYATVMSNILNAGGVNFDTTQWDGFEILLLMPLYNFPHSSKTFGDQMYRGIPSPDWYNLGWPLAVGQDWLAAMEETHALTNSQTAVECSFMAPGLGPWRPVRNTLSPWLAVKQSAFLFCLSVVCEIGF
jgi:hypothetical protein